MAESCPREAWEEQERRFLSKHATRSSDGRATAREHPYEPDHFRTEFERDYTRIIHSRPFRRLRDKTQVFISPQNDHICTRLEHSLHVASVSKTIARALGLNTDLVSAIAVGHDLGHAPFGHKGQKCLDAMAKEQGLEGFSHELHSLRVVDELESPYRTLGFPGLNLTFAVRDGIACHCGERFEPKLVPDRSKQPEGLRHALTEHPSPATLEGCVVRWADKVGYLGRDLEDAYAVGMLSENDIPKNVREVIGTSNREIIARLVGDICEHSRGNDQITVSDEVLEALNALYAFSDRSIYKSPRVQSHFEQVDTAMKLMFDRLMEMNEEARSREDGKLFPDRQRFTGKSGASCVDVLSEFLEDDMPTWRETKPARLVLDFIAGMTDSFFTSSFEELFLPRSAV